MLYQKLTVDWKQLISTNMLELIEEHSKYDTRKLNGYIFLVRIKITKKCKVVKKGLTEGVM